LETTISVPIYSSYIQFNGITTVFVLTLNLSGKDMGVVKRSCETLILCGNDKAPLLTRDNLQISRRMRPKGKRIKKLAPPFPS